LFHSAYGGEPLECNPGVSFIERIRRNCGTFPEASRFSRDHQAGGGIEQHDIAERPVPAR
jgi:hypothetical protein